MSRPWPAKPRPFELTEDEYRKFYEWAQQFRNFNAGCIGGQFTFCFCPTSIGTAVKVKHASGEEIDLTDYDSW